MLKYFSHLNLCLIFQGQETIDINCYLYSSYTYCYKCFNQIPGDTINLGGDPTNTQM